jgi:hypothetical protein
MSTRSRKITFLGSRTGPHLWSSGQSSWLQIQRSGFDSQRYHIFWEVVGMERGTLSFVSTIEEPLERKSSGSGLEIREYGRTDPARWPCGTLYQQKLALTSPTSGGLSVGIVRWRTQATEFVLFCCWGVERGRCVRLTTLPPYVSWLSRQCGILNISQPPWPVTGIV